MKKKFLYAAAIILAVSLIGYAAYQIITTLIERYASKTEYEQVRESYVSSISLGSSDEEAEEEDDGWPDFYVDIAGLLARNEDFVCWIYYEDASISYPVVKETEVNEYLYVTFDGEDNSSGCIFLPYDESEDFDQLNTFLYGHNMADGSMFGCLKKIYNNPEENYSDPYFYIYTKDYRILKYRVIAAYITESDSEMYSIPLGNDSYQEYLNNVLTLGSLSSYIAFTDEENAAMEEYGPMVTLSTCYGSSGTSKRLLVHGVLVDETQNVQTGTLY